MDRFNILLEEDVTYGFRRNLRGLKWLALIVNLATIAVSVALLVQRTIVPNDPSPGLLVTVLAIAAMHACYILFAVTMASVWEASATYERQLALSCDTLMAGDPR